MRALVLDRLDEWSKNNLYDSKGQTKKIIEEMIAILEDPHKSKHPRDDYLELWQLCNIFLGGTSPRSKGFT